MRIIRRLLRIFCFLMTCSVVWVGCSKEEEETTPTQEEEVESITITGFPVGKAMQVGGTMQLSVEIEPAGISDEDVVWKSTDPSVAKVDGNGKVTAIGEGLVSISASVDGVRKSVSIRVYIKEITEITMPSSLTMFRNETKDLEISVNSGASLCDLSVASTDENVCCVVKDESSCSYTVKSVGVGTAKITASFSRFDGTQVSQTCDVVVEKVDPTEMKWVNRYSDGTVSDGFWPKQEVFLKEVQNAKGHFINVTEVGATLSFTPEGADVDLSDVVCSSSNPSVASIQLVEDENGKYFKIEPKGVGKSVFSATYNGLTASCTMEFRPKVSMTWDVNDACYEGPYIYLRAVANGSYEGLDRSVSASDEYHYAKLPVGGYVEVRTDAIGLAVGNNRILEEGSFTNLGPSVIKYEIVNSDNYDDNRIRITGLSAGETVLILEFKSDYGYSVTMKYRVIVE